MTKCVLQRREQTVIQALVAQWRRAADSYSAGRRFESDRGYVTWINDTCDFCKCYMDPIGCDTRTPIGELAWCGQCYEGMHYQWRAFSDADLQVISEYYQGEYDRNPVDFNAKDPSTPGEKFVAMQKRMHQLHCMDTASQTKQYARLRAERSEVAK